MSNVPGTDVIDPEDVSEVTEVAENEVSVVLSELLSEVSLAVADPVGTEPGSEVSDELSSAFEEVVSELSFFLLHAQVKAIDITSVHAKVR